MPRSRRSAVLLACALTFGGLGASGAAGSAAVAAESAEAAATRETFHPLPPARLLDTRTGNGAPKAPVRGGSSLSLQVTGRGGVPATGVSAVVLNVTATGATASAYVTAWPAGEPRPHASTLNVAPRATVPNLVKVKLGAGGKVSLFASAGSAHLLADVSGWFGPDATSGGLYTPLPPARILDTRSGAGPVVAGSPVTVPVAGHGGVPATGVSAVVLNVTATGPTAPAYVTVWPDGPRPLASNLNLAAGQTVPNRVIVKLGSDGAIRMFASAGSVHLLADVGGWYGTTPAGEVGASFHPVSPVRIVDTRTGTGAPKGPLAGGTALTVDVAGRAGAPAATALAPATAVVANVTVTGATAGAYVTAWPDGSARPGTSDLNTAKGATVANLAIVKLGPDGRMKVFNSSGSLHVIVDVLGWYEGDVVLEPEATILTAAQAAGLTTTARPDASSLTFATPPPGLATGDVLVAGVTPKTPYGLLKKVVTIGPGAGGTVVGVEQASLTDVVAEGRLSSSAPLDARTATARPVAGVSTAERAGSIGLEHSISLGIAKQLPSEGAASVTIEGSASIAASAKLDVEIDCCFDVVAEASLELASSIALEVTGTAELSIESNAVPLFRGAFAPLTVPIGPVPVVVVPAMDVDLVVSGKVSYGLSGKVTRSGSVKTGIRYDEHGFDPYFDVEGEPGAFEGPTGELAAEVKAAVKPTGELLVYGVAGPGFSPSVYAKLKVTPCSAQLGVGLELKAEFELSILGKDLGEFSATLTDDLKVVAETDFGVCGGLVVKPADQKVVKGGQLAYVAETIEEGAEPPPLFWTADGGSITAAGLWTAPQQLGTYTITATSQLDSRVTGETTVEVVEPGPIWTGTFTYRWRYEGPYGTSDDETMLETMTLRYTLKGVKQNVGDQYGYIEDAEWDGEGAWSRWSAYCGGLIESASGTASSATEDKAYFSISELGSGEYWLYVGNPGMRLPGRNNNCRGEFGDPYDISHWIAQGSHISVRPVGPAGATTVSGSEHWVGEAPYQDGMQTWVTWQLTREPDSDFDGIPDSKE